MREPCREECATKDKPEEECRGCGHNDNLRFVEGQHYGGLQWFCRYLCRMCYDAGMEHECRRVEGIAAVARGLNLILETLEKKSRTTCPT